MLLYFSTLPPIDAVTDYGCDCKWVIFEVEIVCFDYFSVGSYFMEDLEVISRKKNKYFIINCIIISSST